MLFGDLCRRLPDSWLVVTYFRGEILAWLSGEKLTWIFFYIAAHHFQKGVLKKVHNESGLNYQVGQRRASCRAAASDLVESRFAGNEKISKAYYRRNS